jgi:hypothetical protein
VPIFIGRGAPIHFLGPETMGGFGSGRQGGRPTVENALRLDIDAMIRARVIHPGAHVGAETKFQFYDDEIGVQFEALAGDPWNSWIRLRNVISDYWTGEQHEIDDKIYLATSRPRHGGLRWWFVCPSENRRVRKALSAARRAPISITARLSAGLFITARNGLRQGHKTRKEAVP